MVGPARARGHPRRRHHDVGRAPRGRGHHVRRGEGTVMKGKGSPRAYPRSQAILRREGVQWPEALPPDAWAEYAAVRAAEEAHYDTIDRERHRKLLDARARGQARRS